MSKYKKVLITGGAGFIGSNMALTLIKNGYEVTVLDNLSPQIHDENQEESFLFKLISDKVRFIRGDVTSRDDWKKALTGQDAVIHLAAETGTGQSMYQIYKYSDVNVNGTAILWDILANDQSFNIKKVIVASSRAIYGEGKYSCLVHGDVYPITRSENELIQGNFDCVCPICKDKIALLPTDEDAKINPLSIYGITKYNQEQICLIAGKSLNIPAVAFRYQNVYGPGQSLSNPYTGILSIFSTQIKNNASINIFEDGLESRDFVYIDDVISATILGLESENANYKVFNVGTGQQVNVLDIANKLIKLYKSNCEVIVTGNFRLGDIRHNYADLTRIEQDLGFKPKFQFEEGISNFVGWVNTQEVKADNYLESITELKNRGLYK